MKQGSELNKECQGKMIHLEFARGVASIVVIFHHFFLAFLPGLDFNFRHGGLGETPLYILINGSGAVIFFFVLSGFVLTQSLYRRPAFEALAGSVIKRLPRLMVPASFTIIAGFLILKFGGTFYKSAALLSRSNWLYNFGGAEFPSNFTPTFCSALKQCVSVFFFGYDHYYNSNLWTMKNEFFGSLLVFALSALFIAKPSRKRTLILTLHFLLVLLFSFYQSAFVSFLIGSGLAFFPTLNWSELRFSSRTTFILLAASAVCFSGYWWESNSIGSLFLMLALLGNDPLKKLLSGRFCALIGLASFPLYLVHTLVILSASSILFVYLNSLGLSHILILLVDLIFTLSITTLFSIPFLIFESFWVPWLNTNVRKFTAYGFAVVLGATKQ